MEKAKNMAKLALKAIQVAHAIWELVSWLIGLF